MKYLRQFMIIILISCAGEILYGILPLPVPASIYGLVLMLILLVTGVLKLDYVREAGKFLIAIMPVMFIPAGVGLMDSFGELAPVLLPVLAITAVTTVLVMAVSGRVTQWMILHDRKGQKK